ncbi:hypothetical protein ACJX0J_026062, partial [Zea mays]
FYFPRVLFSIMNQYEMQVTVVVVSILLNLLIQLQVFYEIIFSYSLIVSFQLSSYHVFNSMEDIGGIIYINNSIIFMIIITIMLVYNGYASAITVLIYDIATKTCITIRICCGEGI